MSAKARRVVLETDRKVGIFENVPLIILLSLLEIFIF